MIAAIRSGPWYATAARIASTLSRSTWKKSGRRVPNGSRLAGSPPAEVPPTHLKR